jgi:hypothetical protein
MRRRLAVVTAAVALVTGCGGATGSSQAPSTIVPGSAYMYMEANLDPSGKQEDAIRTVLAALPGVGEPSGRLKEQFDSYAERRYGLRAARFDEDIKPWLGSRMAAFSLLPRRDGGEAPSGLIAATKDEKKARHWLFVVSRQKDERRRVYKGVRYLYGKDGAYAIVDGFVLAADEPALKAVVDRRRGRVLAKQPRFARALRGSDERLGVVWYDTRRLTDTLVRRAGNSYLRAALPAIRRVVPDNPLILTIRAKKKALVMDGEVPAGQGGALTSLFDEGSALMDQLPRDALAVVGQPNFGDYVRKLLALSNAGKGGYAGLRRELKREGFDIERSLLGWMTDAALFLRKDRDGTLGGALVVQSGDANSVYYGTLKLGRYLYRTGAGVRDVRVPGSDLAFTMPLRGMKKKLYVAESGKRIVFAYGADSAEAAISVGGLGGQPYYEAARERLGLDYGPAAYVDIQRLLAAVRPKGLGGAEPMLRSLRYLIVGGRVDKGRLRSHSELVVR